MLTLFNFGPAWGLPDPSPFCLKVDAYLRATGLAFRVESGMQNLRRAPKGKLPYLRDGDEVIADSAFIIGYLKARYGDPLDAHLSDRERAVSHAFIKMLDENLYWCVVHARWIDAAGWREARQQFFGALPMPLRLLLPALARRGVARSLHHHGLGRHGAAEIAVIAGRDLQSLSDLLGAQAYFFGDRISTLDVVAFAFLAECIETPVGGGLGERARSFANLVDFVGRLRTRLYGSA